jgi:hypothetical protein
MARVNPSDPLGYGISLWKDCSKNIKSSSGMNKVYEAILGRLVDTLWYAPDYGIELFNRLRSSSPLTWESLAGQVETELLKDDRLLSVTVDIDYDEPNKIVNVYINGIVISGQSFSLIGDANLLTSTEINFNI